MHTKILISSKQVRTPQIMMLSVVENESISKRFESLISRCLCKGMPSVFITIRQLPEIAKTVDLPGQRMGYARSCTLKPQGSVAGDNPCQCDFNVIIALSYCPKRKEAQISSTSKIPMEYEYGVVRSPR